MASAELIQELIRAHIEDDRSRFRQVALRLAAREARSGHRVVAGHIRDLLESEAPIRETARVEQDVATSIARPSRDLRHVLEMIEPEAALEDIVLEAEAASAFRRILREQHASGKLAQWSLLPRRKLLLFGPPGCGKTLSAFVLAGELGLPLMRVRVESIFSRYLGETAAILAAIFDEMASRRAVYLFDEFDAIGKQRADDSDIGEAKRVVSTFLQLLDADHSTSLVVAATNQRDVLDEALFRRFDDVVPFALPSADALHRLLRQLTASYSLDDSLLSRFASEVVGLSYADVSRGVSEAAKTMVLDDRDRLTADDLHASLRDVRERRDA